MRPLLGIHVMLLTAFVVASAWVWPSLPAEFPIHFDASGEADRIVDATLLNWMLLPLIALVNAALLHGVAAWIERSTDVLNMPAQAAFDALSEDDQNTVAALVRYYVEGVAIGVTLLFAAIHIGTYQVATTGLASLPTYTTVAIWVFLIGILAGTVALVVVLRRTIDDLHAQGSDS